MKNECITIILISALAITLMSSAMFNGIPPARAQDSENKPDIKAQHSENKPDIKGQDSENKPDIKAQDSENKPDIKGQDSENKPDIKGQDSENKPDIKGQANTERQQINKCVKNTPEKDMECNNVFVYGVVCMPGSVCKLERFNVPYELVTPY